MSAEPLSTNQCNHINAAGRRCRMTVAPTHDTLCAQHLQQYLAAQPDPEALAAELLDGTGNLNTADRVNALLANTVKQLARQRINRQDALAIGYLAQLLLNTVPGVQKEYQAIRAAQAKQALRKSLTEAHSRLLPQPTASEPNASVSQFAVTRPARLNGRNAKRGASDSSPEPSGTAELSDEALLAAVLQATSPPRS